jgi:integrase
VPRRNKGDRRRGVLPPAPTPERHYKTAEEIARLATAEPVAPRYTALIYLGCSGALRWSELAGLKGSRLKLLERKLEIVETTNGEPKWWSAGTVRIPAEVAEELAHHLAAFPPGPDGLVFTSPQGKTLNYHNFRRLWQGSGNGGSGADDPARPPTLRVALAIAAGAHPREIQELCPHTSFTTTMNVYGGLFESLHERLAERLGAAFRDGSQTHAGPLRDPSGSKVVELPAT